MQIRKLLKVDGFSIYTYYFGPAKIDVSFSVDGNVTRAQLAVLICRPRKMLINEGIVTKI